LAVPSPFHSWEWNRAWWRHFGGRDKLRILTFSIDGQLAGIAQFYQRRHPFAHLGPTSLVPIGGGRAHKFGLTEQWQLLFPPQHRKELFGALSDWLQKANWSAVQIPGLEDTESLPTWLRERIAVPAELVVQHYFTLPTSWESFLGILGMNARHNLRRYPERLIEDGHNFSFQMAETPTSIQPALNDFLELHAARAKANLKVQHPDRFVRADRRGFLREVAMTLVTSKQMKIGVLRVRERAVAAQIWLHTGDTMFMYYSGFLPEWSRYAVGLVAMSESIKYAISHGVRRVELLRGEGYYKDRWRATRYTQHNIIVARRPTIARSLLTLRAQARRLAAQN
jgi:predicted N-acyltransferase